MPERLSDRLSEVIFVGLAGSHAQGTAGTDSDVDVRGVCIEPLESRLSLFDAFEQYEGELPAMVREPILARLTSVGVIVQTSEPRAHTKIECAIFELAKFLRLLVVANPNALEILFTDPRDVLVQTTAWERLYALRHRFVTNKVAHTFGGYAFAQLKKIEMHRGWLLSPLTKPPLRSDFGLRDESDLSQDEKHRLDFAIQEAERRFEIESTAMPDALVGPWREQMRQLAFELYLQRVSDDQAKSFAHEVQQERAYRAAQKHWKSYLEWKAKRNPRRAELEARFGYDTKHAAHLVRLLESGIELLETGELLTRRPNALRLREIKDGALTFEKLLNETTNLQSKLVEAQRRSQLPDHLGEASKKGNPAWVDMLFRELCLAK